MYHFQGFSVEGQENIQEILSKQLYLCQFLVAVSILRVGEYSSQGKQDGCVESEPSGGIVQVPVSF